MRNSFNNLAFKSGVFKVGRLFMLMLLMSSNLVQAQSFTSGTGVSMPLLLIPTDIIVTPVAASLPEGTGTQQYTAIAQYNYPGTPVPDLDITNDPLTVWSSSIPSVATVNTTGFVTAVSDNDLGSAGVVISATYGGLTGNANLKYSFLPISL